MVFILLFFFPLAAHCSVLFPFGICFVQLSRFLRVHSNPSKDLGNILLNDNDCDDERRFCWLVIAMIQYLASAALLSLMQRSLSGRIVKGRHISQLE